MKASELIEKLKTFDENLIVSFKCPKNVPDNLGFEELDGYLILNCYLEHNNKDFFTVSDCIKEIETFSNQDLNIGLWGWEEVGLSIVGEYLFPVTANLTQQNEYLILELEVI